MYDTDDILLTSTAVSGLQALIKLNCSSVLFIENHALHFNPEKTGSFTQGKNPFCFDPKSHINNVQLSTRCYFKYLQVFYTLQLWGVNKIIIYAAHDILYIMGI